MTAPGERLDAALGDALERAVRAHHRRRLRRTGHGTTVEAAPLTWARQGTPPRDGNSVEVLVDGAAALPAVTAAIDGARSHVHLAGWHVDPTFLMTRDGRPRSVRDVLGAAAERVDVRVLVWSGAPAPVFHPWRREVRRTRDLLRAGTGVQVALDSHQRPLHCHHEKVVVVDDRVAFVGGIDLTGLAGDRFDSTEHPRRDGVGWHDVAVRIEGPAVADVAAHLAMRWEAVTGERMPRPAPPPRAGDTRLQVVRTIPEHTYPELPNGEFGAAEVILGALRSAQRLVSIESQFLWSAEVVSVLADLLRRPPTDSFRMVLMLPALPYSGADDTRGQLGVLCDADAEGGGGRLLACSLAAPGDDTQARHQVYVHAKVTIVDDRWLAVGSANLNEHSLFNDTEMAVVTDDAALARQTRIRLWGEHLGVTPERLQGDSTEVVDRLWRSAAQGMVVGEARAHRVVPLPQVSRRAHRLMGPLQSMVVDG